MNWTEIVQAAKASAVPSWDRWLVGAGIVIGWVVALALFLWRVGVTPVNRSINGVGRRVESIEEWRERTDERLRRVDLDKQRWDSTLDGHRGEMGAMRAEMHGLRDHMDEVKLDILVAIKETGEKTEQQFREMRDRMKEVEVTIRERNRGDGDHR